MKIIWKDSWRLFVINALERSNIKLCVKTFRNSDSLSKFYDNYQWDLLSFGFEIISSGRLWVPLDKKEILKFNETI